MRPLPGIVQVGDIRYLQFPQTLPFVVPILWVAIFFITYVYDPMRTYKAVDEIVGVSLAIGLSTHFFSGILYLFVRDFSRYLILAFVVLNLIFFLGWRIVPRFLRKSQRQAAPDQRVLIGDGEKRQQLESQARNARINNEFLGSLPQKTVFDYMRRSRVFCAPIITARSGNTDAFGMVFAEAQACGLPVVSSNIGGIPEVVINGETGLLVDEGNVSELAASNSRLLLDDEFWTKLSQRCVEHVSYNFD